MEIAIAIILGCCALGAVTSTMLMGCAIAETTGLYALIIVILLLFVTPGMFVDILTETLKILG